MGIKIYLDNCCYNRPFDNQDHIRVRIETEAKLHIQRRIDEGKLLVAWSYILEFENSANPFEIRQISIKKWKNKAFTNVIENGEIIQQAKKISKKGIKAKDSLHISCALWAECEYFLTTDDTLLKKKNEITTIQIVNLIELLDKIEE